MPILSRTTWIRRLSIGLVACLSLLVLSASFFQIPPDWPLKGREKNIKRPNLTWETWSSGKFAKGVEAWTVRHFGLRGLGIRLANQLDYAIFGILPRSRGTAVTQGKEGWLYESSYFPHYVNPSPLPREKAEGTAREIAKLQQLLADKGIPFAVLVTPSKLEICPENLPDGVVRHPDKKPAREELLEAFRKFGVHHVDGRSLLLSWKIQPGTPCLFPPYGTHWNAYAAQRTLNEVIQVADPSLDMPAVIGFDYTSPFGADTDLLELLNLIYYRGPQPLIPYPKLAPLRPSMKRLNVLMIGDSFCHQLIDAMGRTGQFANVRLLYYFHGIFEHHWDEGVRPRHNPPKKAAKRALKSRDAVDWPKEFADKDLVILEFNEVLAAKDAWGFPRKAADGLLGSQP